jgi:hypothetical protein
MLHQYHMQVEPNGDADVHGDAVSRHAMFGEHPLEMSLFHVGLTVHGVVLLIVLTVFQLLLIVLSFHGEQQIPAASI